MNHTVYLGLGTNLGDKEKNLRDAVTEIGKRVGEVTSLSAFHASEPWGFESENSFVNAVCAVSTHLTPSEVLEATQDIERRLGRTRKSDDGVYHDRLIDIDILLYDDWVLNTPELIVPHPLMNVRRFVLEPLAEIASDLVHPVQKKTIGELLFSLTPPADA